MQMKGRQIFCLCACSPVSSVLVTEILYFVQSVNEEL
jgi:hypothetical protein